MAAGAQPAAQAASQVSALPWWVRYSRWRPTSRAEAVAAEKKLLDLCSHPFQVTDVSVGATKQHIMHTITGGPENGTPLVCLPGYGAGAGFLFRNLDAMAQIFRVHSVDLLGNGMSGRPTFRAKSREDAEGFFLTALDRWREAIGIDKMVLVGHSLGGYLAATYALQHPQHVQHLVLVCPAGVRGQPEDWSEPEWTKNPWTWRGQASRALKGLWEGGWTPGSGIRMLGPYGPKLVSGYARNRFRHGGIPMSEEEVGAFEQYFYHIMAQRGSGEFALRWLLAPYAWARHPLEKRLQELKVPVTFIYGEHDWMNPATGKDVCSAIEAKRGKLTPEDLKVDVIPNAGHYAFLEQPHLFMDRFREQLHKYVREAS